MLVHKAITLELGRLNQPIVTLYQASTLINKLYRSGNYRGAQLARIRKRQINRADCLRIIKDLRAQGILEQSYLVRHPEVFHLLGRDEGLPSEIICSIDPFAYISHLSAMEWHGLTDRVGRTVFYSSPSPTRWRLFAREKMKRDIGEDYLQEYFSQKLPALRRINFDKIGRTTVNRHVSEHLGAFTSIKDHQLRVSTIGRTFLDMIREPDLCGGIYHVLDVYEQFGHRYLNLIVDEIDRHGTQIDKIRSGYILEERMRETEPRIDAWKNLAQRGGSRKLYSKGDYSPEHSETWCLSINVEGIEVEPA